MKFAFWVLAVIWLLCGVIGAWMLDDLNRHHLKEIAKGPITLAKAINDNPASIPGAP